MSRTLYSIALSHPPSTKWYEMCLHTLNFIKLYLVSSGHIPWYPKQMLGWPPCNYKNILSIFPYVIWVWKRRIPQNFVVLGKQELSNQSWGYPIFRQTQLICDTYSLFVKFPLKSQLASDMFLNIEPHNTPRPYQVRALSPTMFSQRSTMRLKYYPRILFSYICNWRFPYLATSQNLETMGKVRKLVYLDVCSPLAIS